MSQLPLISMESVRNDSRNCWAEYFRIHRVAEKKSTEQFLLIYIPVAKIPPWSEKVCFGFRLIHCGLGWEGRRGVKTVKNLWSHFGIITIYCSWMILEFFIWTNKHKNMFLYFYFHGNDLFFFFWWKLEREILLNFSVSPSCVNQRFIVVRLRNGKVSHFGSEGFVFFLFNFMSKLSIITFAVRMWKARKSEV